MTRIAFLHAQATKENGGWRVYPCLVLKEHGEFILDKWRRAARLVYIDETGGIRIEDAQHYQDRTSAEYWVLQTELEAMHADIKADWEHRHLWSEAWRDVRDAMILSGFQVEAEADRDPMRRWAR